MSETEELLKLSILYHRLLRDLEDTCGVEFRQRAQAFEIVREFADAVFEAKHENYHDWDGKAMEQ